MEQAFGKEAIQDPNPTFYPFLKVVTSQEVGRKRGWEREGNETGGEEKKVQN